MTSLDILSPEARRAIFALMWRMARADGLLARDELAALAGARLAFGLLGDRAPPPLELVPDRLSTRERLLAYAAVAWLALADGIQARAETRLLEELRARFALGRETAAFLEGHARWVRSSTELPWHRELDFLLTEAARRVDLVLRHRRAA